MSVWLTIPSARPDGGTVPLWRDKGYRIALWRDGDGPPCAEFLSAGEVVVTGRYPGYAKAVNLLVRIALRSDKEASWCVAGGDDTEPDQTRSPEVIAQECCVTFGLRNCKFVGGVDGMPGSPYSTFGVMQPIGDRWAHGSIDRICGSPWLGREFCERMYQGKGPLFEGYSHMFLDEELQLVAQQLGVLWQRPDLIHLHRHYLRQYGNASDVNYGAKVPEHLKQWNTQEHWQQSKALFESRRDAGFPGHEPLESIHA